MSVPFQVNPQTGFLESPPKNTSMSLLRTPFTSDLKLEALRLAHEAIDREEYPSVDRICKKLGIALSNFAKHVKEDPAFCAEWNEVKERLKSTFTEELSFKARSKMGVVANLAMLRWLESGTWLPETKVNHISENGASKQVIDTLPTVIDAELIDNPSDTGENK